MWAARIFIAVFAIAWVDRLAAKETPPETDMALTRPEKPAYRIPKPSECTSSQKRIERVTLQIQDANGKVTYSQVFEVVKGCD